MKKAPQQRFIYKINSIRFLKADYNLNISINEAIEKEEIVPVAESQLIRFIDEVRNIQTNQLYNQVKKIEKKIVYTKNQSINKENKIKIKNYYKEKFEKLLIKDYICITMDKKSHFDRLNSKKGFVFNGIKYKKLLGTTGGVKNSTIIYLNEEIYDIILDKINNGRNLNKEFIPAKLEAYQSLICSASVPVSMPKGVLVVKDCITTFYDKVIKIDDTQSDFPDKTIEENCLIKLNDSDGYGLILPKLSKKWTEEINKESYISSGFCIRNAFCKGMVFTFDYIDWVNKKNNKNFIVEDAWGKKVDVRNVEIILTESMLKLWDSYNSIEEYLECCKKNGYGFCVTKDTPKKLENQRETNYQFLQSLYLTDEMIDKLIEPTVKDIFDVLGNDYKKSLLFLKGIHLDNINFKSEKSDFIKALMIDKRMINDPYVKDRIHKMINKKINEAKIGILKLKANYSIISGDPYSLCQSIFSHKVTGLLKKGEIYSKYWYDLDVGRVACFRAPMTCHNNIRVLNVTNNEDMAYWYQYMTTVTILNSWDTTTHALNGADKDSDAVYTTNSDIILNSIRDTPAIMCVQKDAEKIIPTTKDFNKANKDGFGDEIGVTTNYITSMIDVLANFKEGSEEHEELMYRIMCGQNYQQNAIDKIKGIVAKKMPKCWYNNKENKINKNDDEEIKRIKKLNQKIVANKQPYFFKYIYPQKMKVYNRYINQAKKNCLMRFGITLDELINKKDKNEEENKFLKWYYIKMPLSTSDSVMNKICRKVEEKFDNCKINNIINTDFDYSILMTDKKYDLKAFNKIKQLYSMYRKKAQESIKNYKTKKVDKEEKQVLRQIFIEQFKQKAFEICSNNEELTNMIVELCYKNNKTKQFAWDICGDTIIENLLKHNNYKISYPILDEDGNIEYAGEKFKMIDVEVDYENCFK